MNNKRGFTIIEVLVAIGVIAVVGTVLVLIFTNTLRGNSKSQVLSAIKQNGQAVLDSIGTNIRGANDVVCPGADNVVCPISGLSSNTMVIKDKAGEYTRYRIALPTDGVSTAPESCIGTGKNGCIVQDKPVKKPDSDTGVEEDDCTFIRRICTSVDSITAPNSILTDTNVQTGVLIDRDSGLFTVRRLPGFKAIVEVQFILGPGASAPAVVTGQIDPVTFQTTVQLR